MVFQWVRADKYTFAVLVCGHEISRYRHVAFPQIGHIGSIGSGAAFQRDFLV